MPSKSYAFDFKGKIAKTIFLRFRRLSVSVGRLLHLATTGSVLDSRQKVPSPNAYHALRADAILSTLSPLDQIDQLPSLLLSWSYQRRRF
jgi:hypothetical protein